MKSTTDIIITQRNTINQLRKYWHYSLAHSEWKRWRQVSLASNKLTSITEEKRTSTPYDGWHWKNTQSLPTEHTLCQQNHLARHGTQCHAYPPPATRMMPANGMHLPPPPSILHFGVFRRPPLSHLKHHPRGYGCRGRQMKCCHCMHGVAVLGIHMVQKTASRFHLISQKASLLCAEPPPPLLLLFLLFFFFSFSSTASSFDSRIFRCPFILFFPKSFLTLLPFIHSSFTHFGCANPLLQSFEREPVALISVTSLSLKSVKKTKITR